MVLTGVTGGFLGSKYIFRRSGASSVRRLFPCGGGKFCLSYSLVFLHSIGDDAFGEDDTSAEAADQENDADSGDYDSGSYDSGDFGDFGGGDFGGDF